MVEVLYSNQLKKQINGGVLGTLAAIGIPIAIDLVSKLFGKGLQVPKRYGKRLHVSPKPQNLYPYYPPPFLGSWGEEGGNNVKPSFKDIPLSN